MSVRESCIEDFDMVDKRTTYLILSQVMMISMPTKLHELQYCV